MFSKVLYIFKRTLDYYVIVMIIAVGIFTLIFDGKRYRRMGYVKEKRVAEIISYTYIVLGCLMFIFLLIL